MNYLTSRFLLIAVASLLLVALSVWYFYFLEKPVSELVPNLITDLIFAVLIVRYIEFVDKRQRKRESRARDRVVALAVQKYFQSILAIVSGIIRDGVISSKATKLPTLEEVKKAAEDTSKKGSVVAKGVWKQPVPYAAYFMTKYTGDIDANVYPSRTTQTYLGQRYAGLDPSFREILEIDNGNLPDAVVNALSQSKNNAVVWFAQQIFPGRKFRFGMWAEEELTSLNSNLFVMSEYFREHLAHTKWSPDGFILETITNAFAERQIALVDPEGIAGTK